MKPACLPASDIPCGGVHSTYKNVPSTINFFSILAIGLEWLTKGSSVELSTGNCEEWVCYPLMGDLDWEEAKIGQAPFCVWLTTNDSKWVFFEVGGIPLFRKFRECICLTSGWKFVHISLSSVVWCTDAYVQTYCFYHWLSPTLVIPYRFTFCKCFVYRKCLPFSRAKITIV